VIVKKAVAELPPMTFLALRFGLAFGVLAITFRRALAANWRRLAGPGIVMGACLWAGFALQTVGLQFTLASRAGFITGLSVVLVPLLEGAITRRPPPGRALIGVALALAGLALLFMVPALASTVVDQAVYGGVAAGAGAPASTSAQRAWGDLLVLGCALAFGCHIAATGRYAPTRAGTYAEAGALAAIQVGVATLGYLGLCAVQCFRGGGPTALLPAGATLSHPFSLGTAAAIVLTGLAATAGAFLVQTVAQRFTPPTHTALIFATEPVFAALFGRLVLAERLGPGSLAGCLLILAGMVTAELPGHRRRGATPG
jgi:drug/metabolite transporter (DMT)-like permease